jgi:lipopolysaccharide export system protein LptC
VLLAAASWWLARPATDAPLATAAVAQPGYYLTNAELEQTDTTGRLTLKVHAAEARQLEQHGDVNLEHLRVDYLPEPGRDWRMTSTGGTLLPNGRTVLLAGDVRLSAPDEGAAVVRTEHMRLDVDQQLATTDDPVRMELPPHALTARGMRADLKRETLHLAASVSGTFAR